jgi:hypothetical protein
MPDIGITTIFSPGRRRIASGTRTVMLIAYHHAAALGTPIDSALWIPHGNREVASVNMVENTDGLEVATAQAALGGSCRVSLVGAGLSISPGALSRLPHGQFWFTVVNQVKPGVRMRLPISVEAEPDPDERAASVLFALATERGIQSDGLSE